MLIGYFFFFLFFQFAMCKVTDQVYAETARSLVHTDPASWTEFKVNVMKWACSVGHRACLTAARDFGRKMLRNESPSSSYVFSAPNTRPRIRYQMRPRTRRPLVSIYYRAR